MRVKEKKPEFSLTYASLIQLADKSLDLINRDAAVLATYGINKNVSDLLIKKNQELKDFKSDEELEGLISEETEKKDKLNAEIKTAIRSVMTRVKALYPENAARYKRFGTSALSEMTDNELFKCGKRVVRVATTNLAELSAKGLTQKMIDDLSAICTQFDNQIDAKDTAVRERDIATEGRIMLSNEIYSKITEVFNAGKDYWQTRGEAKYNDYVIYNTPSGKEEEAVETVETIESPQV